MSAETEIAERLISEIVSGRYNVHERLPSENEIAGKYKVPRITARKAYEKLEELGYVYRQQGKGSYVKDRLTQIELVLSGGVSFSQKMLEKGYDFESRNIFSREIKYNKRIYDCLETGEKDRVFKIGRLRFIDGQPIALHISYIAKSVFPDIAAEGANLTSMFSYYNSKGYHEFLSKPSLLSVSFPTKLQRKLLGCTYLVPLLALQSGCIDKRTGAVLECTKILYRCDRFSYIMP
ncbi:putative HTH-type transcriptional regulator YurK [Peptococcaceae bacterium CEB3]|nr:putative HTH-type transcriptional regulator YurK [Peptococcaceae bacterium CEB3]